MDTFLKALTSCVIAWKRAIREPGDGPHSSCMCFAGLEVAVVIVFIGNKLCSGKRSLRSLSVRSNMAPSPGITLWTIWIELNDKVFNREQRHESKVKHLIWDDLIMYAKAAWERAVKQIKISIFLAKAMLQGFDQTWGDRNVLCRNVCHLVHEMQF